jgi:hypothetical protein
MNTPSQTTEFSAHLSWAGMRRYLQEELSDDKSQQIERHLHHCPRCSSAIVDYIRAEEPEHYKQYTKKLKGILKTGQAEKKSVLSSFQMKAIRTTTAVVALLIFSFFALKTVINKQADYSLPSEPLAVVQKSEKIAPVRRESIKKATKAISEGQTAPEKTLKKTANVAKKTANPSATETLPAKAATVITKARPATVPTTAARVRKEQLPGESKTTETVDVSTNLPATEEEMSLPQEDDPETSATPTASRKPLPSLRKIDATQNSAVVAPLGGSAPAEIPVPSSEILER